MFEDECFWASVSEPHTCDFNKAFSLLLMLYNIIIIYNNLCDPLQEKGAFPAKFRLRVRHTVLPHCYALLAVTPPPLFSGEITV